MAVSMLPRRPNLLEQFVRQLCASSTIRPISPPTANRASASRCNSDRNRTFEVVAPAPGRTRWARNS